MAYIGIYNSTGGTNYLIDIFMPGITINFFIQNRISVRKIVCIPVFKILYLQVIVLIIIFFSNYFVYLTNLFKVFKTYCN